MKKIAFLIPTLSNGGAEKVVSVISKYLPSNFDKYIILYNEDSIFYEYDATLLSLDYIGSSSKRKFVKKIHKIIYFPILIGRLKKMKIKYEFDYVISFLNHFNILNILSRKNEKCIISVRNYISLQHTGIDGKIFKFFIKKFFKKADAIIPVSKMIAHELVNKYNINNDKIRVIYNPYNIKNIKHLSNIPISKEIADFITNKTLISVGSFHEKKGHMNLLKVVNHLRKVDSSYKLILIGDGPNRKKYTEYIKKNNFENNVLMTGFIKNPFNIIKKASLFVLSSRHEGFPNVLLEAMICGKAIVSTDCYSGPSEIMAPEKDWKQSVDRLYKTKYGYITPIMNNNDQAMLTAEEELFSKAVSSILNDKIMRIEMEKNTIIRASDFKASSIVHEWEILLNKITLR